jgi:multiple sugar transport system permease protein
LGETEMLDVGNSQLETVTIEGQAHFVLEESLWQPTLDLSLLQTQGRSVPVDSFVNKAQETVSGAVLTVGNIDGEAGQVFQLLANADSVFVVPLELAKDIIMVPATSLRNPFVTSVASFNVRFKDFSLPTVRDETIDRTALPPKVAFFGETQEMALVIPASQLGSPVDVSGTLPRDMTLNFKWQNIADALSRRVGGAGFTTFFTNTLIVTFLNMIGNLFSCTVVAYAFARMRAPGKKILFTIVIATMMLPTFVTLVPVYTIFRDLGLVDTLVPLFIRSFFGNAFFIFLLRQFFSTLPRDLEDAAFIDGATRWQTFTRIILPLVSPALATVAIFTFLGSWNEFFEAAIYLDSPANYTVALGLNAFRASYTTEYTLLMAATTIVMLPTVLLFFFAQRFFIEGITLTGVKG